MSTWQWLATCFACSTVAATLGMVIGGFMRGARDEMEHSSAPRSGGK